jgi:pimeloyl-ACP methyl ester carboxylesterase
VIVAGHSMGGMAIAAWAADHEVGARVQAAALMNTGLENLVATSRILPGRLHPEIRHQVGHHAVLGNPLPVLPVSTGITRALLRYVAFGPHASEAQVAFYEPMLRACPPAVRAAAGRAMSQMELLHALHRLTVPTLVVAGEVDRLTPSSHAELIARAVPQLVELIVLPEIGHMAPLEATSQLVAALSKLAATVGVEPGAAAA